MAIDLDFGTLDLDTTNNIAIRDISITERKNARVVPIAKTDGGTAETARRISISIKVSGDISGTNYDNLLVNIDALKAGLQNGKQKFTIDDDRYVMAQLKSFDYKYIKLERFATWKASFVAHFPYWLSETASTDERTPTSGTPYTITNSGNASARCKIEVTAPAGGIADDLGISISENGLGLRYRGTIVASTTLEVDNRYDTDEFVVENDGTDDHTNYEGDFLVLAPGANNVTYVGPASATVKFTWRNAWL